MNNFELESALLLGLFIGAIELVVSQLQHHLDPIWILTIYTGNIPINRLAWACLHSYYYCHQAYFGLKICLDLTGKIVSNLLTLSCANLDSIVN